MPASRPCLFPACGVGLISALGILIDRDSDGLNVVGYCTYRVQGGRASTPKPKITPRTRCFPSFRSIFLFPITPLHPSVLLPAPVQCRRAPVLCVFSCSFCFVFRSSAAVCGSLFMLQLHTRTQGRLRLRSHVAGPAARLLARTHFSSRRLTSCS